MLRDINGCPAKRTATIILSTAFLGWWKSPDVHEYVSDIYYSLKDILGNLIYLSILVLGRLLLLVTLPISFFVVFAFIRHLQKKQEEKKIINSLKQ